MKREQDKNQIEFIKNVSTMFRMIGLSLSDKIDELISENKLDFTRLNSLVCNYMQNQFDGDYSANKVRYITVNGEAIPLIDIHTWKKEDKYSFLNNRIEYRIVIDVNHYILKFDTKEERDRIFEKISDLKIISVPLQINKIE